MTSVVVYGEGGYNPKKPNNNIVDTYQVDDATFDAVQPDTQALAEALAALPQETLDALKAVLFG